MGSIKSWMCMCYFLLSWWKVTMFKIPNINISNRNCLSWKSLQLHPTWTMPGFSVTNEISDIIQQPATFINHAEPYCIILTVLYCCSDNSLGSAKHHINAECSVTQRTEIKRWETPTHWRQTKATTMAKPDHAVLGVAPRLQGNDYQWPAVRWEHGV